MRLPPTSLVRQNDTHRLTVMSPAAGESVLVRIADDDAHLQAYSTSTRSRTIGCAPSISSCWYRARRVARRPGAAVINATFCHANPVGSRFSGPDRGAWTRADLETAQREWRSTNRSSSPKSTDFRFAHDDYLADFSATFHDLRRSARFARHSIPIVTSRRRRSPNGSSRPNRSASSTQRPAPGTPRAFSSRARRQRAPDELSHDLARRPEPVISAER